MKKNLLWMLAAIFFCGAITTSCSKDDDDKDQPNTPEEQQEVKKATKGDVTLTFLAQTKSLQYFEYDFKYVDAKGNTKTIDIDQDTQSSGSLDDIETKFFKNVISALVSVPAYADLNNPFVYRVVLKDQPVGGKVTYTTTCHVKEGASITETLQYATPSVLATLKLENSEPVSTSIVKISTWKIRPDQWENYVSKQEGKIISEASGEVIVSE